MSLSQVSFVTLGLKMILESFKSKLFQEFKELVIILADWYLLYSWVELINVTYLKIWDNFLYCAVDNSDHFFMLTELALPQ